MFVFVDNAPLFIAPMEAEVARFFFVFRVYDFQGDVVRKTGDLSQYGFAWQMTTQTNVLLRPGTIDRIFMQSVCCVMIESGGSLGGHCVFVRIATDAFRAIVDLHKMSNAEHLAYTETVKLLWYGMSGQIGARSVPY